MENEITNSIATAPKGGGSRSPRVLRGIIIGIAIALVLLLVFSLGVFAGIQKARFSYRWATYYHRNFGGPRGGFMRGFGERDFVDGHGVFGEVIKIDKNLLIVMSRRGTEKSIVVSDKTIIRKRNQAITVSELKVGNILVVIGSPNDKGQIEAKMIRVFSFGR